jgi:signal transduction histidine kinase
VVIRYDDAHKIRYSPYSIPFPAADAMPLLRFLVLAVLFACRTAAAADIELQLAPGSASGARSSAQYYDEAVPALTIEEAVAAPRLFASGSGTHRLGAAMRWIRLPVFNAGTEPGRWVLTLGVPDAQTMEVYQVDGRRILTLLDLAPGAPFAARALPERMLAVPVALAAGTRADIYLRYQTHADTPLVLEFLTQEGFQRRLAEENLFNGAIIGLLAALTLFALLEYLVGGEVAFLAYVGMAALMMGFLMQFEGYNFEYLWPRNGAWNRYAPVLMLAGIQATHTLFAMTLFDMRQRFPRLHRIYLSYLALLPPCLLAYFGAGVSWPGLALTLAYVPLVFATGLYFLRRSLSAAGLFLAGTVANTLFTNLLFGLGVFGFGPAGSPFVYPKIGYVCEALLFALALTRRMQALKRQVDDGLRRHLAEVEELARVEAERHRALQAAQEQQIQLAAAGHDLSQPLASIRLALPALRAQAGTEAATGHIDRALDYTESLLRALIDGVRSGHATQRQSLHLGELLAEVEGRHQDEARRKGLRLRHRPTRYRVEASALVLTRILDNLLGNAIRYTDRGQILLGVRRRAGGLEIQVADTGPGFDMSRRGRLLAPFEQGGTLAEERRGYGLGLHIVQILCEQSGYRLAIRSTPGSGSTFGVLIPSKGA